MTRDKAQLDRRVAEYVWKAAYVLDAEWLALHRGAATERLLWLLCGETCQVTVTTGPASIQRSRTHLICNQ